MLFHFKLVSSSSLLNCILRLLYISEATKQKPILQQIKTYSTLGEMMQPQNTTLQFQRRGV